MVNSQINGRNQINALLISEWTYRRKIQFNLDLNKQAQGVIFSNKALKWTDPVIHFIHSPATCNNIKNHLGLFLGNKLSFSQHIKERLVPAMKEVSVIKKLSGVFLRHSLVIIYKSFVLPYQDYGYIVYHQPNMDKFFQKE